MLRQDNFSYALEWLPSPLVEEGYCPLPRLELRRQKIKQRKDFDPMENSNSDFMQI